MAQRTRLLTVGRFADDELAVVSQSHGHGEEDVVAVRVVEQPAAVEELALQQSGCGAAPASVYDPSLP
jgi:hypothetical protein